MATAAATQIRPLADRVVVKPLVERTDPEIGRVCLKIIANAYLTR